MMMAPYELISPLTQFVEDMAKELAVDVSYASVEGSGHWVPEENPEGLLREVLNFLRWRLSDD